MNESVTTKLLGLSWPLTVQMLAVSTMPLVDVYFVSKLGNNELATVALAKSIFMPVLFFFIALLNSVKIITSQRHGENNKNAIYEIISSAILLAIIFGGTAIILGYFLAPMLSKLAPSPHVGNLFIPYFRIHVLATVPALVFVSIREGRLGYHDVKMATIISVIANIINGYLDYIFIYGRGFHILTRLNGVALATVVSYGFMGFALFWIHIRNICFRNIIIKFADIKMILNYGIYQAIKRGLESALSPLMVIMIGKLGTAQLAGYYLVMQLFSYSFYPVIAISESICVLSGNFLGNKNISKIISSFKSGTVIGLGYVSISSLFIFIFFKYTTLLAYNEINTHGLFSAIIIAIVCQLISSIQSNTWGALRGVGKLWAGVATSIMSFIIVPPALYYLCFIKKLGVSGIFVALTVNGFILSIVCLVVFYNFCMNAKRNLASCNAS